MDSLFRNTEYKRVMAKLLIAQIIFVSILFFALHTSFKYLNANLVEQNAGFVGKLIETFPDYEEEIVTSLLEEVSTVNVETGKVALAKYSYTTHIHIALKPVLAKLYGKLELILTSMTFLFIIPLLLIMHREYAHIYKRIRHISYVAERVVQDDFSHVLPEDDGGDFAILNHNFNQMASRIRLSLMTLRDDKLFLKDIISDISHQLKTPLSSLIMFNELMLEDKDMNAVTRTNFLEKSRDQLARMEWLTINLLKMARLESGSIQFKKNQTPLVYPINIALNTLSSKITDKDINIEVTGDIEHTFVWGDTDWLGEAFINIIKNSIEHTPSGGDIYIHLSHTPIFSQVEIRDTGEGIDKKDLPHIFERFYRSSSSVKVESVGIGLSLAKVIIEEQNGSIWVESKKGRGTKFTITFLRGVI